MKTTDILLQPIITEKSLQEARAKNTYTFKVAKRANKQQIKKAVEEQFDVQVVDVRTVIMPGKIKQTAATRYNPVQTPINKKAYITLDQEDRILESANEVHH